LIIVCLDFARPLSLPHQHSALIRPVYRRFAPSADGFDLPGSGSKFGSREPGYPLTSPLSLHLMTSYSVSYGISVLGIEYASWYVVSF